MHYPIHLFAGRNYESPVVRVESDHRSFSSGDDIELRCDVTGFPPPRVDWTFRRGSLPSNAVADNGILRIRRVGRENEGQYECTASNSAGRSVATIELTLDDS